MILSYKITCWTSQELESSVQEEGEEEEDVEETSHALEMNLKLTAEFPLEHLEEGPKKNKVFFRNKNGEVIALYRCLLYAKQVSLTNST